MNLTLLEKSIIATVAYYDALDYPLTGFEVFKYLINPLHISKISGMSQNTEIEPLENINLLNVLKILEEDNLKFYINQKNGFYFLRGRDEIVQTRIERQKISDQMWKKAKRVIKWLQFLPYIKIIAVSGSLAMYNTKQESDIDLLIITQNKRIWTTRFLITLFLQAIGQRRHGRKTAGRFCLNHYITNKSLKINFPSLYNAQTYAHMVLVLENEQGIYNRFQFENRWITDYLTSYDLQKLDNQRKIKNNSFLGFIAKAKESVLNTFIGSVLEKILGFFQKYHIKHHPLKNEKGGRILADDNQLEFHPLSPETKILDKYNNTMLSLNLMIREQDSGLN